VGKHSINLDHVNYLNWHDREVCLTDGQRLILDDADFSALCRVIKPNDVPLKFNMPKGAILK